MLDTRKIIDYAIDGDANSMRESLYASIYDRVTAHIEAKKQEVAATLLGMPLSTESVESDEPVIEEEKEEDEGHEDEKQDKEMCKDVAKKEVKSHEKKMHGKKEVEKEGY